MAQAGMSSSKARGGSGRDKDHVGWARIPEECHLEKPQMRLSAMTAGDFQEIPANDLNTIQELATDQGLNARQSPRAIGRTTVSRSSAGEHRQKACTFRKRAHAEA